MLQSKSIANELRKGAVSSVILKGLGFAILFVMNLQIGRLLGPEGYGLFGLALAISSTVVVLTSMGWPSAMMRMMARYQESAQWGHWRGLVIRATQVVLGLSLFALAILVGISKSSLVNHSIADSVAYAGLIAAPLAIIALYRKGLMVLGHTKASIVLEDLLLPGLTVAGFLVLSVQTALAGLQLYLAAVCFVALLSIAYFWTSVPDDVRGQRSRFETREWWRIAAPLMIGGLAQMALTRIDIIMLGAMTDPSTTGIYVAASRLAMISGIVLIGVNTIAAPLLAKAYQGGRIEEFFWIFRRSVVWSTAGAVPVIMLLLLVPGLLLGLFGPGFESGADLLRVLALGQFVNAVTGSVGFALIVSRHEKAFAVSTISMMLLNIVGNFIAIPTYGAIGAAWVSAVSVAGLNLWQLWVILARR